MNKVDKTGHGTRKSPRFAWLLEEWFFNVLLVAAVMTVLVEGLSSLRSGSIV